MVGGANSGRHQRLRYRVCTGLKSTPPTWALRTVSGRALTAVFLAALRWSGNLALTIRYLTWRSILPSPSILWERIIYASALKPINADAVDLERCSIPQSDVTGLW